MKKNCPNPNCQNPKIVKDGSYFRRCDSRKIIRYRCLNCGKRLSAATFKLECYQKKRRVNYSLMKLLCSNVSMRRSAKLLNIDRKTVARKLIYLGEKSRQKNQNFLKVKIKTPVANMIFDDLITKENSKLKPLTVSIAVDEDKRHILGAKVAQIPSFGKLAVIALKTYGTRPCHHQKGLNTLMENIENYVAPDAVIKSDMHKKYPRTVKRYFPHATHLQFESERAHVAGQGELKKAKHDPLFMINHTCAMLRANINRLIRKTWCTTKDPSRLQDHIDIFIFYFNTKLIKVELSPLWGTS